MVLVTVFVCRASLDTVQRRAVSKREQEKAFSFKEEKNVKKRVFSRAMAMQKPLLHTVSLESVSLLGD